MFRILLPILLIMLTGCSGNTLKNKGVTQYDKSSISQFGKTDFDRMADYEIRENIESLKILMVKFYKKNPKELRKTSSDNAEIVTNWVFNAKHDWKFKSINFAQGTDALNQAFDESFDGDRVLSLITGLYTMIKKAHGGKIEFFMFDSLDAQAIFNSARNIEIVLWKLSSKRNMYGELFLLSNQMDEKNSNLSFEREFGKIIGRMDYFAYTLSEKSERVITRALQGIATGIFLPF